LLPEEFGGEDGCWNGCPLPAGLEDDVLVVVVELVFGGGGVVVEVEDVVVVLEPGAGGAGGVGGVVGVVVGAGVVAGGQDSETDLAGPGRFSEDTGAPGASWK
jgi:hypothetical protein